MTSAISMNILSAPARDYLSSLVRMDIRRKEKSLARWAPRPGQARSEAEAARDHIAERLKFKRAVLEVLQT